MMTLDVQDGRSFAGLRLNGGLNFLSALSVESEQLTPENRPTKSGV